LATCGGNRCEKETEPGCRTHRSNVAQRGNLFA
jgi:hypothetical protein